MRYKDLAQKAETALKAGLQCILNNSLPSYWDGNGCGWHEQWMNADYSGVYAACEGVILLSQARRYITEERYAKIVNSVYKCNLCIIFDELIAIDATDELAVNKRIQRDKALNAAYKLAKFLWASSYVDKDKNYKSILFFLELIFY